jgi:hypothetical protein
LAAIPAAALASPASAETNNWASAAAASSEYSGSLAGVPFVGSTGHCTDELEGIVNGADGLVNEAEFIVNNAPEFAQFVVDITWSEARAAGAPLPEDSPDVPDPGLPDVDLPELDLPDVDLPDGCTPAIGVNGVEGGAWSAERATGAPDTYPACGDIGTAWAPRSSGTDPESITTLYSPVPNAQRVDIYETNVGGFVTEVKVHTADGSSTTVFTGPDSTPCPGILSIPLSGNPTVVGVEIHTQAPSWEEIDAVSVVN